MFLVVRERWMNSAIGVKTFRTALRSLILVLDSSIEASDCWNAAMFIDLV